MISLLDIEDGTVHRLKTLVFDFISFAQMINMDLSPDGRYIAYHLPVPDDGKNNDIHLLSVETQTDSKIVKHPADERLLGFTPDGGYLMFTSDRRGSTDAWLLPLADGRAAGPPELLVSRIGDIQPLGFTDQGAFAYGTDSGRGKIYVAGFDADTGKVTEVPQESLLIMPANTRSPAYSPDGRYLAYISKDRMTSRGRSTILHIRSLGSGKERAYSLDENPGIVPYFFDLEWSPDNRRLLGTALDGRDRSSHFLLCAIDVDTGAIEVIKKCETGFDDQGISGASWSKDGQSIFYVLSTKPGKISQLFVLELESGIEKEIYHTDHSSRFSISRSPDGRWLAALVYNKSDGEQNETRKLLVISTDGREARELYRYESSHNPVWNPAWTRDGKCVLFPMHQSEQGPKHELWRIAFEGGEPERVGLTTIQLHNLAFHPDGTRIAYTSHGSSLKQSELWMMENFLPASAKEK